MRIFLTPVGSAGDNYPFIGVGTEMARRGHDVTVFTNEHFGPLVKKCGLSFVQVGTDEEYRRVQNDPLLWDPMKGFKTVMALVAKLHEKLLAELSPRIEPGNTAIVAHSLDFVSRCLQDKTGLPVVSMHLQPALFRSLHQMPVMFGTKDLSNFPTWIKRGFWWITDRIISDPVIGPPLNRMRAGMGLPAVSRIFGGWIHSPLLTLGMFPEWFAPKQPDWPASFQAASFPLFDAPGAQGVTDDVDAFLNAGDKPIVFTPGSAMVHGHEFFAAAADACARLGRRGMLLSRHREHISPNLPEGVRHFDFAPLSEILPRCAAIVHHGGVGTTGAGLAGGVPQVIMPMSHDQPDNAHRIKRLGVGDQLSPKQFTGDKLAMILDVLLKSADVSGACTKYSRKLNAENGIGQACDLIERACVQPMRR